VLATKSPLKENRASLLATMKKLTAAPLSSLSDRRTILPQQLVEVASTKPPLGLQPEW